jgi:hypothetical protein
MGTSQFFESRTHVCGPAASFCAHNYVYIVYIQMALEEEFFTKFSASPY